MSAKEGQEASLVDIHQQRGHGGASLSTSADEQGEDNPAAASNFVNKSANDLLDSGIDDICSILKIQSLLNQFSHPRVRADFLNHKFSWIINPSLLQKLDGLRCLLFPRWTCGHLDGQPGHRDLQAARHLRFLISKDNSPCIFPGDEVSDALTYKTWFDLLDNIASDKYWNTVASEEICTHIQQSDSLESSGENHHRQKVERHLKIRQKQSSIKQEVECSSSTESNTSDCDSTCDDTDEEIVSTARKNARRSRYDKREVVTPPPFVLDGKVTLSSYLTTYEKYFDNKFNGTAYDKTQELGKFLDGELLTVYKIRGGRKMKYKDMKAELLAWFKKQKIGSKSYWQDKFEGTQPEVAEALDLYGLRLQELVQLAYPTSGSERQKRLKKHFLESIDCEIAEKVTDANRTVKMAKKKGGLSFTEMVNMARELQKESTKKVSWMQENLQAKKLRTSPFNSWEQPQAPSNELSSSTVKIYSNRNRSLSAGGQYRSTSKSPGKNCNYCKRVGHTKQECWRAAKSCLICGKQHAMSECSKYDPEYRKKRQQSRESIHRNENLNGQALLKWGKLEAYSNEVPSYESYL